MTGSVVETIRNQIAQHDVVLYMKGTAQAPLCGFSAKVVQILNGLGVPFLDVNVLADPELREGIKAFTQWPTIPQLYVRQEFVGGCDIVSQMYQAGELQTLCKGLGA